jgi:polar amino acid transport system substrate-binding protein
VKVKVAYIEEPPFYWTDENGTVTGSDIELAEAVLHAIGVTSIEYVPTTFAEFLPGVAEGRWDMNVPIFVSPDREKLVAFSVPVWALGDGFIVPGGNPKGLTSYQSMGARVDARLGTISGTVQIESAKQDGVAESQIVMFRDQPDAMKALLAGKIDAFVGTAVGNRSLARAYEGVETVDHDLGQGGRAPVGAFSFRKDNHDLLNAVNAELKKYLGSPDHRARVSKFGLTNTEIDSVL